jgi:hypothetical protein
MENKRRICGQTGTETKGVTTKGVTDGTITHALPVSFFDQPVFCKFEKAAASFAD